MVLTQKYTTTKIDDILVVYMWLLRLLTSLTILRTLCGKNKLNCYHMSITNHKSKGHNYGCFWDPLLNWWAFPPTFLAMRHSKMLRNPILLSWLSFSLELPLFFLNSFLRFFCFLPVLAQDASAHIAPHQSRFTCPYFLL